ncbi:LysM peptidoglycan-binding domain-containing protein [Parablautia muri]|uniref:LysM peptidoglycan-binding domain-containing protein n=1 Tax=Parablautia muri TaxID=2320879 RepID=A0A9X5BJ10_9FIRM|nr:LysM peptidoglycan-binding domain-containing protein [Parablautia muri]NBJ94980.1 LysM peptidoglycan-binding domain-containing protein [Parablautia muri]
MAIGYLTIQARTAHDALPLDGAQIWIMDDQEKRVYHLTTDESGETERISLETLERALSLNPDFHGTPFISYNVLAFADGFNSVHIIGIPILDGETAIQPIEFIPMRRMQRIPTVTEIHIGAPAVSMTGNRYQTIPDTEPQVLRQVVIPNPITVHLGSPGAAATNVQVSFPNYVKNVASSEIYPTWPDASLRANIYAIITFALNRIYTEWYRSRGYSFDITNNTAYDQYFIYGRNIYESISLIVDEIFNEFVRRQGQIAPYFTSFCNGTTVTCAGLSQWGTVTLANQGLTPLQILRSYYPKDVEIAETNIITGVLSSYPGTALKTGSIGLDVQTIQTYLERIRCNYPAIPVITDKAGVFGQSTKAAVTKFQSIFNLTPDGIVGKATWNKLSYLYTAVTRLAELDSEGTNLGIGTIPPSSVLRLGSSGQDVITLQYLLNVAAEFNSAIPAPAQDGDFGIETQQAVAAFQSAAGLKPDGIVGPLTWQALYQTYLGVGDIIPPSPDTGTIDYIVRSGDTLWLLAQRYHTTVDAIKNLNGLSSDNLSIGQVLKIPTTESPGGSYFEYVVRSGDTLWLLAQRYHTTVDAIKNLNGLSSSNLNIGQILKIPSAGTAPAPYFEYTVRSGDTLWQLAQRFGTTVSKIKSLNNLSSDILNIGQVLLIPND